MSNPVIERNDLVLVLGNKDVLPIKPCLGIVINDPQDELLHVRLQKFFVKDRVSQDCLWLKPDKIRVVLICKGDKTAKPSKNFNKSFYYILPDVILSAFITLFNQAEKPPIDIAPGALIIVKDYKDPGENCWAIVRKVMPSGQLDVVLGKKLVVLRESNLVPAENSYPILQLEKPGSNVKKVVLKHTPELMTLLFCELIKMGKLRPLEFKPDW